MVQCFETSKCRLPACLPVCLFVCLSSKHVHAAHTLSDIVQVLEVVAEEEAEGVPYLELLTAHPADGEEAEQTQKPSSQPQSGGAKQQASVPHPDGVFSWCI